MMFQMNSNADYFVEDENYEKVHCDILSTFVKKQKHVSVRSKNKKKMEARARKG